MSIANVVRRSESESDIDPNSSLSRLKRIERILRNGLPTDDEAEVSTIAHAHSEIELLLESIDEDWWLQRGRRCSNTVST